MDSAINKEELGSFKQNLDNDLLLWWWLLQFLKFQSWNDQMGWLHVDLSKSKGQHKNIYINNFEENNY